MMQQSIAPHGRMHALDGLRAAMMLLGIVLHSMASYTATVMGEAWPYDDSATTIFADFGVFFIHVFRMPIFFVLAGFFAAMLCQRRGVAGMLRNRLQRIGWPFLGALLVLFPLVISGFTFANVARVSSIGEAWQAVAAIAGSPGLYLPNSTLHLWFLYYLLWFYVIAVSIGAIGSRLPTAWRRAGHTAFRRVVEQPVARVAVPALVTAVTLLPMAGVLDTQTSFIPDVAVFVAYFAFFGFGWLLYGVHDVVPRFARGAWSLTIGATIVYFAFEGLMLPALRAAEAAQSIVVVQSLVNAVVVWMLFFGFTGLFLKYLDRPAPSVRYIVDGSYWVYLVHLPCTIWIPGLLVGTDLSVWARMSIVLAGTTMFGFVTYALFVRSTWIGHVLNGRRYPRGLPKMTELVTPAARHV